LSADNNGVGPTGAGALGDALHAKVLACDNLDWKAITWPCPKILKQCTCALLSLNLAEIVYISLLDAVNGAMTCFAETLQKPLEAIAIHLANFSMRKQCSRLALWQ
jgi:hypothetical protein